MHNETLERQERRFVKRSLPRRGMASGLSYPRAYNESSLSGLLEPLPAIMIAMRRGTNLPGTASPARTWKGADPSPGPMEGLDLRWEDFLKGTTRQRMKQLTGSRYYK